MQGFPDAGSYAPPIAAEPTGRPPLTGRAAMLADGGALLGLALLAALSLFLFYKAEYNGLHNPDAQDYAQIGRNMADGRGFTTYILRPLALSHGDDPLRQPDVTHGPLYPFALAVAFGALGASDHAVVLVSGLFFILTCPLIYLLGVRVFSRGVGLFAAAVHALALGSLQIALSGIHLSLLTLLVTALLVVLYNLALDGAQGEAVREAGGWFPLPRLQLLLVGALAGAIYAAEPVLFPIALVVLFGVGRLYRRQRSALVFALIPMVAIMAPIMVRNHQLTGNAVLGLRFMELWMHTEANPVYELYRRLPGSEVALGAGSLARKLGEGLEVFIRGYPDVVGAWIFAFFLVSLFFRFDDEPANRLRGLLLAALGLVAACMLPFVLNVRLLSAFTPGVVVFGCAFLLYLLQQSPRRPLWWCGAGFGIVFLATFSTARETLLVRKLEPPAATATASVLGGVNAMAGGDVCLSDSPWLVAWRAERPSLWLPASDAQAAELRKRFRTLRWMMLTEDTQGVSTQWATIYGVFRQWNESVVAARRARRQEPGSLQIRGGTAGPALFNALQGFISVPPTDRTSPLVVLAALPPERPSSSGGRPAGTPGRGNAGAR